LNTGLIGAQLRKWTDHDLAGSVAARCRLRRLALFSALLNELPRPLKILDIGGEAGFWNAVSENTLTGLEVTLLNLAFPSETGARFPRVLGDARHMPFLSDHEFDVVFSNSVLEHLGTFEDQSRMAAEVRRVGRRYFVQTPSKWFPLEPHFLVPAFQFLPLTWRVWIAGHYGGGWYCRPGDRTAARKEVESIRLLTERECRRLFPGATLRIERLFGMTKSYMIVSGWPRV
jgi:hypothetical protein